MLTAAVIAAYARGEENLTVAASAGIDAAAAFLKDTIDERPY